MRNFSNGLLSILIFIMIIITISVLSIATIIGEDSTRNILDNIDYNDAIEGIKSTDYGNYIYDYASEHGIDESRVDAILQTGETKNYSNQVLQAFINAYLENGEINLDQETKAFIDKINQKYDLEFSEEEKEELENYTNEVINENLESIKNNYSTNDENGLFLLSIVKFCQNNDFHITLFIITAVLLVLLFFNTLKSRNFLEYVGTILITVGIASLLFNGLISIVTKNMEATWISAESILLPITNNFYSIAFIGLIGGIVFLVIQHFISNFLNKEVVPF